MTLEFCIDDKPISSYNYLDELKQLYMKVAAVAVVENVAVIVVVIVVVVVEIVVVFVF